jgi:putative membrane protein
MKPEGLLSATWALVRLEAYFFLHYPKMLLSAGVVVLIPALYVVIYLTSVWDPAAKTGALPVGIVNLDKGLVYRGQGFNVRHPDPPGILNGTSHQ